ncbi:hypothetical protein L7F22_063511 [Adiantum nelumboides]|nr:hypothetical protein [Adiantum nelumboides]
MQGWHSQRLFGNGDIGDPFVKEKAPSSSVKRAKQLKIGLLRKKKAIGFERGAHTSRNKGSRSLLEGQVKDENLEEVDDPSYFSIQKKKTAKHDQGKQGWKRIGFNSTNGDDIWVTDEGPEADWVKINVHKARDCFEVYALVPGLLRDEVRIQCEPGGQLVIVGEPEERDSPWGITSFKKVINLPLPIDASQTSAVVTVHGQLFVLDSTALAHHPQTDGQSEIANLTVLDLLKAYVTEVDQRSQWEEYVYNNTVHMSTRKAPFEVIEGRPKSPLLLKVHGKIFAADEYSRDLKESFQKTAANKHRRALAFKENDWILLKFPKARLRHTTGKNPMGHQKYYAKLAKKYYDPFQILKPINEMAYQLKFPNHWLIHNAFHVSLLKPYKGEPPKEAITEDPPEVEGQEEVLQTESVLRHEDKVLRHGKIIRRYLIKFKNYPFEDARWMQGTQLKDSLHLVNAYNDSLEIKQGKLSVKKYVQKIKELTRRLNEPPSEMRMRAWFLIGFNSRKLREQEVPAPTKKFTELMHRALKLEHQAKKEKSRHRSRSDSCTSKSTKTKKSSSSSSESSKDDKKRKKKGS